MADAMVNVKAIIKREDLYEAVWKTPVLRLAPTYGISDVALKKICKQLNVPTPPPGYWTQIRAGWKIKRPPLPKLPYGAPATYTLHPEQPKIRKPKIAEDPSTLQLKKLAVPPRLTNPHPLIEQTRRVLKDEKPNDWGILRPNDKNILSVRVGPDSVPRALRIMNTLVKALEGRRASIYIGSFRHTGDPETEIHIDGEEIRIFLRERIFSEKKAPENLIKRFLRRYPKEWGRYSYYPTGVLELYLDEYVDGKQKKWADTPKKKLEEKLGDFIIGLLDIVPDMRQQRLEREERERRWQEEKEERRRWEEEKERLRALEETAETWIRSEKLRSFVREVERRASQKELSGDSKDKLEEWIKLATAHADSLDPLSKGLPFVDGD